MEDSPVTPLSFVFAIVIPGPDLKLHRFVRERVFPLGESSGLAVWWQLISSPTLADPIYRNLRSPELILRDNADELEYDRLCRQAGGEEQYQRGEYYKLAGMHGLREDQLPAVVFVARPACDSNATLLLSPSAFESGERMRTLACFIYDELGEDRVRQFTEDGEFTAQSMGNLQSYLDQVGKTIADSIAQGREVSKRAWDSYLRLEGLEDWEDPTASTVGTAWRHQGNLVLRTETNGNVDGQVEFRLRDGDATLQMSLMWLLLLAWPHRVGFLEIAEELYAEEFQSARRCNDEHALKIIAKRIRSLVHDVRDDKLEDAGINPEILPTIRNTGAKSHSLGLCLANLDRRRLGRTPRPRS